VYPNYEPFMALAAAAAVTERIRLATTIAILPYRVNATLVAKQAATIHHLSNGRFLLGAAVGGRPDDYEASGVPFEGRGKRFEEMLERMKEVWDGDEIGPHVDPPPPLLIGGGVDVTFKRAARYGEGWIQGGGTPEAMAEGREKTEKAWKEAGRKGKPRIVGLAYYSLGADAEKNADAYLHHYYAWLGEIADMIAGSAAKDADTVKQYNAAFEQAGADELIWFPSSPDPEQVDLLAEAAL
jgi:alkanesulfonate monooxygenase SsuD/methylene tetrahydromethanopterin reductase-like flavin-dependent oxidoreductase (luciferase family)